MKRKIGLVICSVLLCLSAFISGCEKKEDANDYLGRLITRAKENEDEFSGVLENGITEIDDSGDYVLTFPEELKTSYEIFLKEAFTHVQFELNKAEKETKTMYVIQVSYEPIDIEKTTADANAEFVKTISGTDFAEEAKKLLEKDTDLLEDPVKQEKKSSSINVYKSDDGYYVEPEDLNALLVDALPGYMAPYEAVLSTFDMRNFMQAYLDAYFKGELEQLQLYTKLSAEEAAAWYEDSFHTFRREELNDEQNERFVAAIKKIYQQSVYELDALQKLSETECQFELTASPNISMLQIVKELEDGTYYTTEQVAEALLEICDKYAEAPAYGEVTTVTIQWDSLSTAADPAKNENFSLLMETIIPSK